ncbi:MAG: hypothetical protein JSS20_03220 [Proteobacteria bacterium]|nr:hypothetical protein [Pseudomonadota bacterium]
MSDFPIVDDSLPFEAVQEILAEKDLSDGLPMVAPTEGRIEDMLSDAKTPDEPIGAMPPMFGEITRRSIAYNAVLAGCQPGSLPVLEAALTACLEPEFNLLGLTTTTGSAAVATIVHGPIVRDLGLNPTINCLGPGNRANATLGRAISLCLRNIGGAREGSGDMATCGQPGKYTFCFAERSDGPIAPLALRRGVSSGRSAVTVLGVSGTAEVLPLRDGEGGDAGPDAILDALALIMAASVETTGAARQPHPPEQFFILPLELAERLTQSGFDLAKMRSYVMEAGKKSGCKVAASGDDIHPVIAGGAGVKMAYLPMWGGGSRSVTRPI